MGALDLGGYEPEAAVRWLLDHLRKPPEKVLGQQMFGHVAKLRSGDPAQNILFQWVKNVVLIDHGTSNQSR